MSTMLHSAIASLRAQEGYRLLVRSPKDPPYGRTDCPTNGRARPLTNHAHYTPPEYIGPNCRFAAGQLSELPCSESWPALIRADERFARLIARSDGRSVARRTIVSRSDSFIGKGGSRLPSSESCPALRAQLPSSPSWASPALQSGAPSYPLFQRNLLSRLNNTPAGGILTADRR